MAIPDRSGGAIPKPIKKDKVKNKFEEREDAKPSDNIIPNEPYSKSNCI